MLRGVKVLDLSRALAGPYGTLLLGDLGAEIIKIEMPGRGDDTRSLVDVTLGGIAAYYLSINRNKKSVVLDLKRKEGRDVFYRMVEKADVVFDNFRPGVVEKLGVDYETLKKINPGIICCSISGYGHTGPFKDRPAFDLVVQGMGGGMSITGEPGRAPVRMGFAIGDLGGGIFGAMGVLAALISRQRTGEGQKVDISMLDCQLSLLSYVGQYYLINGIVPQPIGSAHQSLVPYQAFKASDRWIVITCTPQFWPQMCKAIGRQELETDPRFDSPLARLKNRDQLIPILEEILAQKTADEWLSALEEAGVPCGPVNTLDRAFSDPQILARDMVVEIDHPTAGRYRAVGNPIKSSLLEKTQRFFAPPRLGEHTEEVLKEFGCTDDEISSLVQSGVIGLMTG